MTKNDEAQHLGGKPKIEWAGIVLIVVICEKIVQHIAVTFAFYFNWKSLLSTVSFDPGILMVLGALAAVLFIVSLWGVIIRRKWAPTLVIFLALFDIIGEFVAQGRIDIVINVSFLVAVLLLILALPTRRKLGKISL